MKPHVSRRKCGCLEWVVTSGEPALEYDNATPANAISYYTRWRYAFDAALAATVAIRLREKGLV